MVVHFLFFDHDENHIKSYKNHINIDTPQFKSAFVCKDVKKLVEEFAVTFIVSPANSLGFMNGGIDDIYMDMFPGIQKTVQDEIAKFNITASIGRKALPIGSTIIVQTKNAKTPYLCCTPTMFLPSKLGEADNVYWAFMSLLQTFKHYTNIKKIVVACPCLGTGVGRLKARDSAKEIQRAFNDFANKQVKYSGQILCDSPKGFVVNTIQSQQTQNSANTEVKNIQVKKKVLTLLTWNIWFKQFHFQERMDHIVVELKKYDPDVVCFQEVTKHSIVYLKNNSYISFKYDIMYDHSIEAGYGDIVLVKKVIKKCFMSSEPYPETNMTRRMTRVYLPCFECEVCTTHLESVFKTSDTLNTKYAQNNIKHKQFKHLLKEMGNSKAKNVILAGDFNFTQYDEAPVKQFIDASPFKDVYETLPEDKKGIIVNTYDSTKNKNILGDYQSRLDRVYIYSKDNDKALNPFNYKIIGTTPFIPREPSQQGYVYPSDHFGLLCTFTL